MIRLYAALTFGHFRRHRLELALCLLGVALGVAVAVAMDSAIAACVGSFRGAVQSLAERSTHSIFAGDGGISDRQYIALLKRKLPIPLAPMIDRNVLVSAGAKIPFVARLLGVDVFSEKSLRSFTQLQSSLDDSARQAFLTEPGQVVLVDLLADRLGARTGDRIELTVGDHRVAVRVCGIARVTGIARAQLSDLIIADLATAQELTDCIGFIDRIDTRLESAAQARALAAALPAGMELRSTSRQSQSLEELIASYRLNLGALSLMASFVAVFIVYNSMLVSVQQRAASLGVLRCLGASRWQLGGLYLAEAILFAAAGAAIGIAAGSALSHAMVGSIATTINDLYAAVRPNPVALSRRMIVKGIAISFISCLLGAFVPLISASRSMPINAFRPSARHRAGRPMPAWLALAGVGLLGAAWAVERLPTASPALGFVMAILIALGFSLMCPFLVSLICVLTGVIARQLQLLPLQMAAASVGRSLGITGVAVAATMLAMAMNISVRTMVHSFRLSLAGWIEQRFSADVFVAPELLVKHKIDATLDPRVVQWVRARPQTHSVITYRMRPIEVAGISTTLVATDAREVLGTIPIKSRMGSSELFSPAGDALISEPLAGRAKLKTGDFIEVPSPTGMRRFRVFAIYFDFGNEHGQALIDASVYAEHWHDPKINSLHVTLRPGVDRDATAAEWSAALRENYPVAVSSSRTVKTEVMAVFDRTFAVTDALSWLAGAVAFCGLAGSLLALSLARQRDYSVLAAIGMTGRQTVAFVIGQGMLIAWTAALIAAVAGTLLGFVLSYVIQYRSFGWSIPTSAQPRFWLMNLILATAAAVIAAIYPILRCAIPHPPWAFGMNEWLAQGPL